MEHKPQGSQIFKNVQEDDRIHLLVDIQKKIRSGKGEGYRQWATVYNLKQMASTLLYLHDNNIDSFDDLDRVTEEAVSRFHSLRNSIKAIEDEMSKNVELQRHIQNYAKTRAVYDEYRKGGWKEKFYEAHRADISLHKASKKAFNDLGLKKLPKIRELRQSYTESIEKKRGLYPEYREAKKRMKELLKAKQNVDIFYKENLKLEKERHQRDIRER